MMASLVTSMLKSFWTKSIDSELAKSDKLDSRSSPASIDLRRLGTPSDLAFLPIIAYAYDPLPAQPGCLDQPSFQLPSGATATARNSFLSLNAVQLHPRSAGLPLRCSIDHVYASRFWKSNLAETVTLLNLLASDDSTSDIEVDRGLTVAKLARKALRPGLEHDIVLGTHYMFPLADEQRVKHISALMIYYFVFDGAFSSVDISATSDLYVQTKSKRLQTELYGKRKSSESLMVADSDSSSIFFAIISCAALKGILATIQTRAPSEVTWTNSSMALSPKMQPAGMGAKKCWMACATPSAASIPPTKVSSPLMNT